VWAASDFVVGDEGAVTVLLGGDVILGRIDRSFRIPATRHRVSLPSAMPPLC